MVLQNRVQSKLRRSRKKGQFLDDLDKIDPKTTSPLVAPPRNTVPTEIDASIVRKSGGMIEGSAAQFDVKTEKRGEFSKEKGGFVTEGGQVYPTDKPEFRPTQVPAKEVKFNKDNTVTVTQGGQTITQTKEQYNEALRLERLGVGQARTAQPGFDSFTEADVQEQAGQGVPQTDLRGGLLGDSLEFGANLVESFGSFLPEFLQFGTKKNVGVQQAEARFLDNTATLDRQISLYQQGLIPRSAVERSIAQSEEAIVQLQKQTKGLGQANLRFWLDQGREIEAQIIRQLATLETQKAALNQRLLQ